MTRKFCDRCDKQCETLALVGVESSLEKTTPISHELCSGCWRELIDFFKPLPKEAPMKENFYVGVR